MYYPKAKFPVPFVWVYGRVPRKTSKTPGVIDYNRYFGHLLIELEDIRDFGRVPCFLCVSQFSWWLVHVCVNAVQNTRPQQRFPQKSCSDLPTKHNSRRKMERLGGYRPRRCQQHCGRVRVPRVVPTLYVIPMLVTPIISKEEGSTINILGITAMNVKKETAFPFKCG